MFAWTLPPQDVDGDRFGSIDDNGTPASVVFDEMVDIQKEIITELGLHARILEMPSADLGASATRKIDIEAYFPSRTAIDNGYGEVTSASICTDYQSRRLATKVKHSHAAKLEFPDTVNGTAMAIPRIVACLLENHWDDAHRCVRIPTVLKRYMPDDMATIQSSRR
jgi:seryl-tRNA synthetase